MKWTLITLFPEMFDSLLGGSLFGKAMEAGLVEVERINFRDWGEGRHRVVDDKPFGGGAGMVIKPEPVAQAIAKVRAQSPAARVVLLSPRGPLLNQQTARRLASLAHVALVCGRYEGIDERVIPLVDEELGVGEYVLSGGEPAAWIVMDAVSRLLPGFLGSPISAEEESYSDAHPLEYPQYTRPRVFQGQEVPAVLLSGDHEAIRRWRRRQSLWITRCRRPDLFAQVELSEEESRWLRDMEDKTAEETQQVE